MNTIDLHNAMIANEKRDRKRHPERYITTTVTYSYSRPSYSYPTIEQDNSSYISAYKSAYVETYKKVHPNAVVVCNAQIYGHKNPYYAKMDAIRDAEKDAAYDSNRRDDRIKRNFSHGALRVEVTIDFKSNKNCNYK